MFLMTRMPPGAARNKPTDVRMSAGEAEPGLVLTQDIRVLPGLQRGMHQPGFTHLVLSGEERRVINMHRNLERYLDLPESERMTGGGMYRQRTRVRRIGDTPKFNRAQSAPEKARKRSRFPACDDRVRIPVVTNEDGYRTGCICDIRFVGHRRARRLCQRFRRTWVSNPAGSASADARGHARSADDEVTDVQFALIATQINRDERSAKLKRLQRRAPAH